MGWGRRGRPSRARSLTHTHTHTHSLSPYTHPLVPEHVGLGEARNRQTDGQGRKNVPEGVERAMRGRERRPRLRRAVAGGLEGGGTRGRRAPAGSSPWRRAPAGDLGEQVPPPRAPAKPGAASSAPAQAPRRPAPSCHWLAKNASLICAHLCTPPPSSPRLLGSDLPPSRSPGAVRRDAVAAAAAAQPPLSPGSRPGLRPAPDAPLCPVAPPMVPGPPAPR